MSWLSRYNDPYNEMEPWFGSGLLPSDFHSNRIMPRSSCHHNSPYCRPWQMVRGGVDDLSKDYKSLQISENGFQACVDVQHFNPEELNVKIQGHTVIVEGKHEERDDAHGQIQRHFVRKFVLPKEYNMDTVQSTLSSDGVLTIKAPPPQAIEGGPNERRIDVTHTNAPARIGMKQHKQQQNQNEESMETK